MRAEGGGAQDGRPAKFEKRKAIIVRTAIKVINLRGVRNMTLAEIANELDLVPTAVNYYFRRKEDLAAICFLQAIEHYNGLLDAAEGGATPEFRLRIFLQAFAGHLAAVDTGQAEAVVTFNDVRTIADQAVDLAYTEMFRRFRRLLEVSGADRAPRSVRNGRTHLLISQVFWAVLWLRQYDPGDYGRMVDRMADILVSGLAGRHTVWAPVALPAPASIADKATREAFLRAATETINEHGYLGASVARISARLNVTKGSFYHHHQAKHDLVEQCFDRTLDVLRDGQLQADALTTTGFSNLTSLAAEMIRRDISGEAPLLRTSALTAVNEDAQPALVARFNSVSLRLASVVSDGMADGSVSPVDANVAAQAITCLVNASAELRHWVPEVDPAIAVETYARPLFMGLLSS